MLRVRELDRFLKLMKLWMLKDENKKVLWGIEDVAFQTLAFQNFWTDPTLATVAMVKFPVPEGSKQDRAMALSLRAKEGKLCVVKNPVWNQPFKNQLMAFPFDAHDDIVDSASGGLHIMAKYGSGEKKKAGSHQG
jgi:phage terminase large subunit-like protein